MWYTAVRHVIKHVGDHSKSFFHMLSLSSVYLVAAMAFVQSLLCSSANLSNHCLITSTLYKIGPAPPWSATFPS